VSPVRYELGFYNPEDGILHSHRRENLNSYKVPVSATRKSEGNCDESNGGLVCHSASEPTCEAGGRMEGRRGH
jgi:hypothetical protein